MAIDFLKDFFINIGPLVKVWLPAFHTAWIGTIAFYVIKRVLNNKVSSVSSFSMITKQLVYILYVLIIGLTFLINLPMEDTTQGQLLSLLGILITATIALSSTTFIGNAMAGLMVKLAYNIKPGDFLTVTDNFGRISELNLLNIEIQTENRELITLPNLLLLNNPVKVIRSSGTIISADVSLGYQLDRQKIKDLLLEAARESELKEPFVQVLSLNDYSVTYKVSGFLEEVKTLITSRSRLKANILDVFHHNRVEILSPSFMNQRRINDDPVMPTQVITNHTEEDHEIPDDLIFDKANHAELKSKVEARMNSLKQAITQEEGLIKAAEDEDIKQKGQLKVAQFQKRIELLQKKLKELNGSSESEK